MAITTEPEKVKHSETVWFRTQNVVLTCSMGGNHHKTDSPENNRYQGKSKGFLFNVGIRRKPESFFPAEPKAGVFSNMNLCLYIGPDVYPNDSKFSNRQI